MISQKTRHTYLILLIVCGIFMPGIFAPVPLRAQEVWPPFWFSLTPYHDAGQITYRVSLSSRVDWDFFDMAIKLPLPQGVRYLGSSTHDGASVDFDGQEITVFAALMQRRLDDVSFTVEIVDPNATTFTTQAWLTWKGQTPGDYLTNPIALDITRTPLDWIRPGRPRLLLKGKAIVNDTLITYEISPKNIDWRPVMWDVQVHLPLPEGVTLRSVETPSAFVANAQAHQVSFTALQLARDAHLSPLKVTVSITEDVAAPLVTHAWAIWKNVGQDVGTRIPAVESVMTGDLVVQPRTQQQVLTDRKQDVPFGLYDMTSLTFQEVGTALEVTFNTVEPVASTGQPIRYTLFINRDCNLTTGNWAGAEYWLRYDLTRGRARWLIWDETTASSSQPVAVPGYIDDKRIIMQTPADFLKANPEFCWSAEAQNKLETFQRTLPDDKYPDQGDRDLARYQTTGLTSASAMPESNLTTAEQAVSEAKPVLRVPIPSPPIPDTATFAPPTFFADAAIQGKIAVPIRNDAGMYDLLLLALPSGQPIALIPNGQQPDFRYDGRRLLMKKHTAAGHETLIEYDFETKTDIILSPQPQADYPFYDSWGQQVVYENGDVRSPSLQIQCSRALSAPCPATSNQPLRLAANQAEIQGHYPVWAPNGDIAYQGCNFWADGRNCGLYLASLKTTRQLDTGDRPKQLTANPNDIPTDASGNLIAFMRRHHNNWDIYTVDLAGKTLHNRSNNPTAHDGLPTFSPHGNWLAFLSNRDGRWAVWIIPTQGGPVQKLIDLPENSVQDEDMPNWLYARLSWGL